MRLSDTGQRKWRDGNVYARPVVHCADIFQVVLEMLVSQIEKLESIVGLERRQC